MFPPFLSPRWRWPTVAVVIGMLFLARLGFWQLDRLEWRRALNASTAAELAQPPLSLNDSLDGVDLTEIENRQVIAAGTYDYERQFVIESQPLNGRQGVLLLTPLRLDGRNEAVLINRGWVPTGTDISAFDGRPEAELAGYVQRSQTLSGGRQTEVSADRRLFRIDIEAMGAELPYPILPIYLLPLADERPTNDFPILLEPDLSLSEGSHLSYAIQWFSFAVLLGIIYWVFVKRQADQRQQTSDNREV